MSGYVTSSFGWYVVVATFVFMMLYLGCVAFVLPKLRYYKLLKDGKMTQKEKTALGHEIGLDYYVSMIIYTVLMLLTLVGFTYWMSFGQSSALLTITQANGVNITKEFLINNADQLNFTWPLGIVLWSLSRLFFISFALIYNDGYGYHFLNIWHQGCWNKAIGFTFLILTIIVTLLTVICFFCAFTWPGYPKVFGGEIVVPGLLELFWLGGTVAIFARQIYWFCRFGGHPHNAESMKPKDEESSE